MKVEKNQNTGGVCIIQNHKGGEFIRFKPKGKSLF